MDFLSDVIGILMALTPVAGLSALIIAALKFRSGGGIRLEHGSEFMKYVIWAAIFFSLSWVVSTLAPNSDVTKSLGAGADQWGIVAALGKPVTYIATNVIPLAAGVLVYRAVIESAEGTSPVPSIIAALLVAIVGAAGKSIATYDSKTEITAVFQSMLGFAITTTATSIGVICIVGAIFRFSQSKPWKQLALTALAFFSVSTIMQLVAKWAGITITTSTSSSLPYLGSSSTTSGFGGAMNSMSGYLAYTIMPAFVIGFIIMAVIALSNRRNEGNYLIAAAASALVGGIVALANTWTSGNPDQILTTMFQYIGHSIMPLVGVYFLARGVVSKSGLFTRLNIGDDYLRYFFAAIGCFLLSGVSLLLANWTQTNFPEFN